MLDSETVGADDLAARDRGDGAPGLGRDRVLDEADGPVDEPAVDSTGVVGAGADDRLELAGARVAPEAGLLVRGHDMAVPAPPCRVLVQPLGALASVGDDGGRLTV